MDQLEHLLQRFKLDENEIKIYLTLNKKGALTATQLSKQSGIPKTSVYRYIEDLKSKKLIDEIMEENSRVFELSPIENWSFLVQEKKREVEILSNTLPQIIDALSLSSKEDISKSKIKYYSGVEGLKQITWNSSKAKENLRIFEIKNMSAFMNFDFAELTRQEFVKNKVFVKELTNEDDVPGWTNITEMVEKFWELRYIESKELDMKFEMLVYNDVFVMYNYEDGDIFGAEIYNKRLAEMQKQIFDFIWVKAKRMTILDKHGAATAKALPKSQITNTKSQN